MNVGYPIHLLAVTDSTNNYAMEKILSGEATHGEVYMALQQTAGKGQRGKKWVADAGMNIIMSVVLNTRCLKMEQQFLLSMTIALGCCDFFKKYTHGPHIHIKWPNDLYWHDRKAGGILIENRIQSGSAGPVWTWSVVGIGININQVEFPNEIAARATSLRAITGRAEDIHQLASSLCSALNERWQQLIESEGTMLREEYNNLLYKKNEQVLLKKGGQVWETTIQEVDASGMLVTSDTATHRFASGEVEWMQ